MVILKCLRVRLIFFVLLLSIIWIVFYYFVKFSSKDVSQTDTLVAAKRGSNIVDIAVFYECLCPDSRSFFLKQLLPVVEKIPSRLAIDFVPYGKAETKVIGPSKYEFTCQHGPQECLGNKIHSCSIKKVLDDFTKTRVLSCMISGKVNPEESGSKCAKEFNLDWKSIWECAIGNEGDELLKLSGDKTNSLYPKVTFIPTILLNNDLGNQAAILKDLWKQVCEKFEEMEQIPKECSSG